MSIINHRFNQEIEYLVLSEDADEPQWISSPDQSLLIEYWSNLMGFVPIPSEYNLPPQEVYRIPDTKNSACLIDSPECRLTVFDDLRNRDHPNAKRYLVDLIESIFQFVLA